MAAPFANPPFANLNLNEGLEDSLLCGATIAQYSRVWYNTSGQIMPANNTTDIAIGTVKQPGVNGAYAVVRLDFPQQLGLANTLINVGDTIYGAANGAVSSASSNNAQLGVAKYGSIAPAANTGNNLTPVVYFAAKKSA